MPPPNVDEPRTCHLPKRLRPRDVSPSRRVKQEASRHKALAKRIRERPLEKIDFGELAQRISRDDPPPRSGLAWIFYIYRLIKLNADLDYAVRDGFGIMQILVDVGLLTQELHEDHVSVRSTFAIGGWYRWTPPPDP